MKALAETGQGLPLEPLCKALGLSRATLYRHSAPASVSSTARPRPARALLDDEQDGVVELLASERFVDLAPAEVFYMLLDEGRYVCSERTMYRILSARGEVKERRNQRVHPPYARPELMATAPNQVWSWDITRLRTTVKWVYFYLYVLLDIFSRKAVGWMIAREETAGHAKVLIAETIDKEGVEPNMLVLHADRGAQMRSKTLAQMLADFDVARSFSRPHVSNDNPFSESQFKTAKYHPTYPGKFPALDDALTWGRVFFPWYNGEHRHSGIAYLTPADVHAGRAEELLAQRHRVLLEAYARHPERFPKGPPKLQLLPPAVYINPPAASTDQGPCDGDPSLVGRGSPAGGWGRAEPPVPASGAAANAAPPNAGPPGSGTTTADRAPFNAGPRALSREVELH